MSEHGSIEWQLEQAENALRDIREIAEQFKTKAWKSVEFRARHTLEHNIITRAAQEAGKKRNN